MTAEVLRWMSDAVDAALAAGRERERAAFGRGRALGHEEGRRALEAQEAERYRLMDTPWKSLSREPSYAELDRRRNGPGGRPSQIIRIHPDDPRYPAWAASLEAARLPPDCGSWPRDLRRRARRRGDKDPFHIRWGKDMTCTACHYWGLPCPDDDLEEYVTFRTAPCGKSTTAHPPHRYPHAEFSEAPPDMLPCPGWSEEDAAASAIVAALAAHRDAGAWLDCGGRTAGLLLGLIEPTLIDDLTEGGLNDRLERLFGVEVRIVEGDTPRWELATLAGPVASGEVPR